MSTKIMADILNVYKISYEHIGFSPKEFVDYYDITLSPGEKISKLETRLTEIGLALKAFSMPTLRLLMSDGICQLVVQKKDIQSATFDSVLLPSGFLGMCFGITESGTFLNSDIHALPHMIVAGSPGSGKSMFLHSLIFSAIKHSNQGRTIDLYLIDPKMVEFNLYKNNAFVKQTISCVVEAKNMLETIKHRMEERYKILSAANKRNVIDYNTTMKKRINPILVVIDEWADLFMGDKTLEKDLCAIAQKGRAAGISIVLATQRPSIKIISGLIKANFPGRVCFKVTSRVDSQVVLDRPGADQLPSSGYGLFDDNKSGTPILFKSIYIENVEAEYKKFCVIPKKTITDYFNDFEKTLTRLL